jgi:hypothetical protein
MLAAYPLTAQDAIRWTRASAPDGSFSLQQPEGWTAKFGPSTVRLGNAARDEEIVVLRLPRDPSKSAAVYAEAVAKSFQQALGSFAMSNLSTAQDSAAFLLKYTSNGKSYSGPGVVMMKPEVVWWVGYGSPSAADMARGGTLITAVARSLADGGGAPAPATSQAYTLTGNWGTVGFYGDLVNPSTGAFVQSSYTGEWYMFNADGTYRYTIAGSGRFITGVVICNGTYDASGNTIRLHQKTESWYPLPNDATHKLAYKDKPTPEETTITIEPKSAMEILVHKGTSTTTFKKDPKSK